MRHLPSAVPSLVSAGARPTRRALEPPTGPGPATRRDAVTERWVSRRVLAREREWAAVVSVIEALVARHQGDAWRVAKEYATLEARGTIVRRLVSPAVPADGFVRWWLAVGRTRERRLDARCA